MGQRVAQNVADRGVDFVASRVRVADPGRWSGSRLCDVALALMGLIVAAPLLAVTAALIWLQGDGPVLYSQIRVGKGGTPFRLHKFRTMTVDADARLANLRASDPMVDTEWKTLQKLRNDPRITPFGAYLRRSCIDELPQLINVLIGDMSIVGPRPITEAQINDYGRFFSAYASVRPGLTGLWQVARDRHPSFRGRVAADRLYLLHKSFAGDVAILLMTVRVVLAGKGSN